MSWFKSEVFFFFFFFLSNGAYVYVCVSVLFPRIEPVGNPTGRSAFALNCVP